MSKYRYMLIAQGYGGELVVGTTNDEFATYWAESVAEDGDSDLVEYLTAWDDQEDEPEDALVDPNRPPTPGTEDREWYPGNWHDIDDFEHISTCFADSRYSVVPVIGEDDLDYDNESWHELSDTHRFSSRECYISDEKPEDTDDEYIPVVACFSSEKGGFWNVMLELDEPFDPKLLTVTVVETDLCELVDGVYYNGELLDLEYDYADTTGKGFYATTGWLNTKWYDSEHTQEMLEWGIEDWKTELEEA
jgi:hypothetical protein